jgi:hypothetical protein
MFKFIFGTIFGIVISTIGVQGLANIANHGVSKVQEVAKEVSK